nr:FecR domain-containing protein [uncultured Duganella sp.]
MSIERSVARRAAHWTMLMHCGEATPADIDACRRWRAADPEHERAWRLAESLQQKIGTLAPDLAMNTLGRGRRHERRAGLKALLLLMTTAPVAYVAWRNDALPDWAADQRTGVGQQRGVTLADGTLIRLNTDSAMDIRFDQDERLVVLRRGEILVETGHAAEYAARPLTVLTEHGRMRALGTRFVVRLHGDQTRIAVQEGAVEILPAAGGATRVLQAGQQTRFSGAVVQAPDAASRQVDAWTRGMLFASDMPLGEFAAELGRYQRGLLRCDPAVAQLHISGAFQLSHVDAVLDALPRSLPVNVIYRTRYWITIVPRAPV